MASWQAFVMNGVLRVAMKRHGNGPLDLARVRKSTLNPPRRALQIPEGWRVDEVRGDGGLSFDVAQRALAAATEPADVVLYLHGGGYFFGSPKTHRQIIIAMAKAFDGPCYGLDCSGSTSHVLRAAGLMNGSMPSKGFQKYGKSGPGKYITVFARDGHVFMTICGLRFDTTSSGSGHVGPRWMTKPRNTQGFRLRHPTGV